MAAFAFTDGYVAINGTNVSSYVKSVAFHVEASEVDATSMGDSGWMKPLAGLKSGNVQITFNQDMASGALDATMWPLMFSTVSLEVRATASAVGASNPKYTGNILVREWTPIQGAPGDLASLSVTFPTSGAVTRATS